MKSRVGREERLGYRLAYDLGRSIGTQLLAVVRETNEAEGIATLIDRFSFLGTGEVAASVLLGLEEALADRGLYYAAARVCLYRAEGSPRRRIEVYGILAEACGRQGQVDEIAKLTRSASQH